MSRTTAELDAVIEQVLRDGELVHEHPAPGTWLVDLPGTKKLKTVCGLSVGEHALRVEAFVCRQPDENREQLWTFLLQHNARMYGVSYSIDNVGDVYLTGRLPHAAVTPEDARPHPRLGAQLRRRPLQHDAGDRLRDVDPPRVGLAGQARRVAAQPRGVRRLRRSLPPR
ncbi:YbjN domain-containing protein [Blastococcus sp. TML/M2B]|uniref:YbjN domain-containing protein n=1 Tax=Blastococcus sp. TML/M2B TaxID=2798727 RepID=UPI001F5B32B0|nr:YbjN domain-containing protein [Blastococcus sp. TML/M2B]